MKLLLQIPGAINLLLVPIKIEMCLSFRCLQNDRYTGSDGKWPCWGAVHNLIIRSLQRFRKVRDPPAHD